MSDDLNLEVSFSEPNLSQVGGANKTSRTGQWMTVIVFDLLLNISSFE